MPVNLDDLTIREAPRDVLVINRRRLVRALTSLPECLSADDVAHIAEIARWQSTWQPAAS